MLNLYAIHDAKTGAYMNPWPAHTDESAQREFQQAIANEKTPFMADLMSYSLFRIGQWNEREGILTPELPPHYVITAKDAFTSMQHDQEIFRKLLGEQQNAEDSIVEPEVRNNTPSIN